MHLFFPSAPHGRWALGTHHPALDKHLNFILTHNLQQTYYIQGVSVPKTPQGQAPASQPPVHAQLVQAMTSQYLVGGSRRGLM